METVTKVVTYHRLEAQFRQVILAVFASRFVISQIAVLHSLRRCILTTTQLCNQAHNT